jgi:hypothetical protein
MSSARRPKKKPLPHVFSEIKSVPDEDFHDGGLGDISTHSISEGSSVIFEGIDLDPLDEQPSQYRHTAHGLQKQELQRTESAAMRETAVAEPTSARGGAGASILGERTTVAQCHMGY